MMFRLERLLSYRTMSLLGCVLIVSGVLLSAWPLLHNLYIGLGFLLCSSSNKASTTASKFSRLEGSGEKVERRQK